MDTRTKIVDGRIPFRVSNQKARFVTGHFDPLLAGHARRLHELASPEHLLIVVVTNPNEPLLTQRARAELVAALAFVDLVVMADSMDETRIGPEFIEHVRCKSSIA